MKVLLSVCTPFIIYEMSSSSAKLRIHKFSAGLGKIYINQLSLLNVLCIYYSFMDRNTVLFCVPGATASTKAPTALPSFQSVVKLLMGRSGNLL